MFFSILILSTSEISWRFTIYNCLTCSLRASYYLTIDSYANLEGSLGGPNRVLFAISLEVLFVGV